ncbi:MAG: hypothetical protein HQ582_15450 [Planctomycetes bacterium]|nr:hypothetical protein [Planctomycetota bacterium]
MHAQILRGVLHPEVVNGRAGAAASPFSTDRADDGTSATLRPMEGVDLTDPKSAPFRYSHRNERWLFVHNTRAPIAQAVWEMINILLGENGQALDDEGFAVVGISSVPDLCGSFYEAMSNWGCRNAEKLLLREGGITTWTRRQGRRRKP